MKEMHQLERSAGSLAGFKLVVTHVKPPESSIERIKTQLATENDLKLDLIYPVQGKLIDL
jgi:3',5'-cyclic-nucleotide phosphodiesterase